MLGRTVKVTGVLTALVLFFASAFADETKIPKQTVSIPAGSVLHMKLTTTLTSKTNKTGDPFTGQVTQPINVDGKEVVPKFQVPWTTQIMRPVLTPKTTKARSKGAARARKMPLRVLELPEPWEPGQAPLSAWVTK